MVWWKTLVLVFMWMFSLPENKHCLRACVCSAASLFLPGQGGPHVVTQIIRGQAVSTAISGANTVATVTGQGAASPTASGQTPAGTPRAQGQGQVKLTLAQLSQLTQVKETDFTSTNKLSLSKTNESLVCNILIRLFSKYTAWNRLKTFTSACIHY